MRGVKTKFQMKKAPDQGNFSFIQAMSWIVSATQKFDIKSYTSPLNTIVIKHYKYRNCRIHEKTFVKVYPIVYLLQLMTTQFTSAYIINISKKKFLEL